MIPVEIPGYTRRRLGVVGVDAGLIWIGDPCYIIHANPLSSDLGRTWGEFCDELGDKPHHEFDSGVVTSTLHGDGAYVVYGYFEPGFNNPSFVLVDFR
jgi:hypothetical protein